MRTARQVEFTLNAPGLARPAVPGERIEVPAGTTITAEMSLDVPRGDYAGRFNRINTIEFIVVTPKTVEVKPQPISGIGAERVSERIAVGPEGVVIRARGRRHRARRAGPHVLFERRFAFRLAGHRPARSWPGVREKFCHQRPHFFFFFFFFFFFCICSSRRWAGLSSPSTGRWCRSLYKPVEWRDAIEQFRSLPPLGFGLGTRADLVANVLLFPSAHLFLDRQPYSWPGAGSPAPSRAAVVVLIATAAAVALEFTQILVCRPNSHA